MIALYSTCRHPTGRSTASLTGAAVEQVNVNTRCPASSQARRTWRLSGATSWVSYRWTSASPAYANSPWRLRSSHQPARDARPTWVAHVADGGAGSYLPLRQQERAYLARQTHRSPGSARRSKQPGKTQRLSQAARERLSSHEPVGSVVFSTWNTRVVDAWVPM